MDNIELQKQRKKEYNKLYYNRGGKAKHQSIYLKSEVHKKKIDNICADEDLLLTIVNKVGVEKLLALYMIKVNAVKIL